MKRVLPFIVMAAFACNSATNSSAPTNCTEPARALVAASDYSSSGVGGWFSDGGIELRYGVDLGADPALSITNGRCFYVARDKGLLVELDPTCGAPTQKIDVDPNSSGVDPQDVAAASDGTLFVPRYNVGDLLVVAGPALTTLSSISLASFDADGNPQPATANLVAVNGVEKIFVALERLDDNNGLASTRPSMVARIDVKTRAVDGQMTLVGKNPFGLAATLSDQLYFAEPGNFNDATEDLAGIERFDPATMTSVLLAHEADLGGSVTEVAVEQGCGAAIVANAVAEVNATSLVTFDPTTGNVHVSASASPLTTPGFDLEGLAWISGILYVGDRERAPGGYPIHAFSADASCTLTQLPDAIFSPQQPIAIKLPR